jgi:hypothetical protein
MRKNDRSDGFFRRNADFSDMVKFAVQVSAREMVNQPCGKKTPPEAEGNASGGE